MDEFQLDVDASTMVSNHGTGRYGCVCHYKCWSENIYSPSTIAGFSFLFLVGQIFICYFRPVGPVWYGWWCLKVEMLIGHVHLRNVKTSQNPQAETAISIPKHTILITAHWLNFEVSEQPVLPVVAKKAP